MRLTEQLHLAIPIFDGDGPDARICAWVHSAPISREVFEANFLLVSKTYAAIIGSGLGELAGPGVASMMLRTVARTLVARDEDPDSLTRPLMEEIRRLTNVLAPTPRGWETMPLHEAIAKGLLTAEDASEVENAITFFTVASAIHPRRMRAEFLGGAARLWGAETTYSNCTAFAASLPTSTPAGSSGAKPPIAADKPPAPAPQGAVVEVEGVASSLPV